MALCLRNRYLVARFSEADGQLVHLSAAGRGPGQVSRAFLRYYDFDACRWFSNEGTEGHAPIRAEGVSADAVSVVSTHRSAHLEIALRFELASDAPLLAATVSVRGLGGTARLGWLALPGLVFASDFLDVFEDPRERYDDGIELPGGRERPCWRVFFRRGYRAGLLLATRAKRDMARFDILARGFNLEPHGVWNYTATPGVARAPLIPTAGRDWAARFDLGPWTAVRHRALVRAARLDVPVAVDAPPARGRPPRGLRGHVLALAPKAGRAAGRELHPRRWLAVRVPWAWKDRVLFAPTSVRPPALLLRPAWRGWHRVCVGIGSGAGAVLRVPGEPAPRIRLRLSEDGSPGALDRVLSGAQKPIEVDFGVVLLDGRPLRLERFPDSQRPCMLDYIRFEPLTPAQAARWVREDRAPTILPLSGLADIPDIASVLDPANPDPRLFAANIWAHARAGVRKIHWRIDGQCSDYPSRVNTMRYVSAKVHGVFVPQAKAYGRVLQKTDMLRLAVDAARRYGVSLYGWMRFNNYVGNVQSDFFKQHPEYWEESESGVRCRKLCLAHPEVRRHKIAILVEAASYGLDGLCLGFLRHPPVLHYAPILCEAFQRRYGTPPPRDPKHPDPGHVQSFPERDDPEYARWWTFRAGYLTAFGRELKAALNAHGLGRVKVAIWVRPNHCLFDGIDLDTWLSEGLCDEVITQRYHAGIVPPGLYWETPAWKALVRARVPLVRAVQPDLRDARGEIARIRAGGYDGICSYESNATVLDTGFLRLFRSLRRAGRGRGGDHG